MAGNRQSSPIEIYETATGKLPSAGFLAELAAGVEQCISIRKYAKERKITTSVLPILMTDLYNNLPPGKTAESILRIQNPKSDMLEKHWILDPSKISLTYRLVNYNNSQSIYETDAYLITENNDAIRTVNQFYARNQVLLPFQTTHTSISVITLNHSDDQLNMLENARNTQYTKLHEQYRTNNKTKFLQHRYFYSQHPDIHHTARNDKF